MIEFRLIPLTQGQIAKVSLQDYDYLMQWKWHSHWNPVLQRFYAKRNENLPNGQQRALWMHRAILGLPHGDPRQVDHIDRLDTLNNTRENIRIATRSQNCMNRKQREGASSPYKNVYRMSENCWKSVITVDGKSIHLGCRATAELAYVELYLPAVAKYHGEFARPA